MPRLPIPRYPKKPHSSGQARMRWQGRDYYLGPFGSPESLEAYQRLVTQIRETGMTPLPADRLRALTVADLAERYLGGHCRDYYGGDAADRYRRVKTVIDRFAAVVGRDRAAGEVGGPDLKAFQRALVGDGFVRKFINHQAGVVRRMFRWGLSERLVPGDVVASIDAVENLHKGRTAASEGRPVPPADEAAIEQAKAKLPTQILRDMLDLQLWTGMRPGEVCKIRPRDVDRSGTVHLPRQAPLTFPGCWVYAPDGHKNEFRGQLRLVLIGPRGQAILRPYLEGRPPTAPCFSPADSEASRRQAQRAARRSPLWPSHTARYAAQRVKRPERAAGDRYTPAAYYTAIRRACERAGCGHWHPHQLRHNAATRLAAEFGEDVARIVLGHATSEATRIYIDDLKRVAAIMGKADTRAG